MPLKPLKHTLLKLFPAAQNNITTSFLARFEKMYPCHTFRHTIVILPRWLLYKNLIRVGCRCATLIGFSPGYGVLNVCSNGSRSVRGCPTVWWAVCVRLRYGIWSVEHARCSLITPRGAHGEFEEHNWVEKVKNGYKLLVQFLLLAQCAVCVLRCFWCGQMSKFSTKVLF